MPRQCFRSRLYFCIMLKFKSCFKTDKIEHCNLTETEKEDTKFTASLVSKI